MEAKKNIHPFTEGESKYMTKASLRFHVRKIIKKFNFKKLGSPKMLTLMGEDPSLEKDLWNDFNNKLEITSIEYDKKVFNKQKKIIEEHRVPIQLFNKDAKTFLTNLKEKFHVIYFDLCCSRTQSVISLIDLIFKNAFDKNCKEAIFAITLSTRNEQDILANNLRFKLAEEYGKDTPEYFKKLSEGHTYIREHIVPDAINKIAWKYGLSVELCSNNLYQDFYNRKSCTKMYTYIFKVVNKPFQKINFLKAGINILKRNNMKERDLKKHEQLQ